MKVTDKDVAYVADLANLELTEQERAGMVRDLNSILDYVDRLNELDTSDVQPMAQVSDRYGVDESKQGSERFLYASREDVVEGLRKSLPHAEALANAPDADEDFFRVPKVIDDSPQVSPLNRMDLASLTIDAARAAVQDRKTTAFALAEAHYARIQQEDGQIGAFLTLSKDRALAQADRIDRMAAEGKLLPPLGGVPVGIKDVMSTRGLRTTAGSKILESYVPPYDCTAVARLEAAGAVVLGKMNCDEFAMGSSNENSAYRPVRNPRDPSRVPGGSSGGSAAAVAADMAVVTLGSDTGGSIRQPASFCGVVGLMPTYGRVSRYGLIAFASSLDHIGPLAKTVKDAAIVLGTIAGRDPMDSTSAEVPVPDYVAELDRPVHGMKLGVAKEYFAEGLDDEVRQAVESAIDKLRTLGCEIIPVSLLHTPYAIPTYYLIATAEASANLARYDGVRYSHRARGVRTLSEMYRRSRDEGFGAEVKRRIMLGTYALSAGYYDAYYLKAQKVRTLLTRDFDEAFRKVDAIVTPTSPTAAFRLGEKSNDPLAMYLADIYTVTADLAGIPGISIPCGETKEKLPIGLQILGKHFDEATILRLAHAYEQASKRHSAAGL